MARNRARFFLVKNEFRHTFLIKMTIFVNESEEKGSKRRTDRKLVNKGQNSVFQQLSSTIFARFKFLARKIFCEP